MRNRRFVSPSIVAFGFGVASAFGLTPAWQASAQAPSPSKPVVVAPDYSHESVVIEKFDTVYRYAADGTGDKEVSAVLSLHDEAAVKNWSVISFSFASSAEHVDIRYVRVRHADGSVVETPAADAQEQPASVTREAPFYSDLKEEQIPIRSLRAGDHLEYDIRIVRTHPEAPGHFWGSDSFYTVSSGTVVLEQSMELRVPSATYLQVWSPRYKPVITDATGEKVYRWESSQTIPVAGKDKDALLRMDKEAIAEEEPRLPHLAWSNFHSWQEVGAWYRKMEGDRIVPDDEVRSRVTELTAGKTTQEEKARAIYGFVGPQVRYIGVAFGVGRYQPHQASEVLQNQYGDCKDKHTLQSAMLSVAGISSDAALIGADEPFTPDLPSPGWFNHVITLAHIDGKPVWLDATAEVAPFQLLLPTIRGKQALVVPATGDAYLATTPKDPPFPLTTEFDADGTLDDQGTSHSHMVLTLRGDVEVIFRQAARSVSPAQWDQLMQNISYSMSYAGKVTNAEFARPEITAEPFRVTYDYEREKAGDWDNLRIIPQFPPIGLGPVDEKDLPILPIPLGVASVQIAHAVMKLPTGWSAELPPDVHAKSTFATLDKTYKFENGTLTVDRRIVVLQEKIPADDWRLYQKWYKDAGADGETYVQLTRSGAAHAAVAAPYNDEAANLINEAVQLEQSHSWDDAVRKLDAAKALNPHQAYLWSHYAFIASMYGKTNEALDDFKLEIADHPAEDGPYCGMAQLQRQQHKNKEAEQTLHTLLVQFPGDVEATQMLASILFSDKDFAGAEAALRTSLTLNPKNDDLKLQLGDTLLQDGKPAEAQPLLSDIVNDSTDTNQLNNAAYEMANASLDLPLAEKGIRHALDLLDNQTATNDSADGNIARLRRASLLIATWDSLGWVLYREGKLQQAEPWVRASWRNSQVMETGYHLGVILQDETHAAEAADVFQLAASLGNGSAKVRKQIDDRQSTLKKSGFKGSVKDPKAQLQSDRTFAVPRGGSTLVGGGTFDLAISPQGTVSATFISGDPAMKVFEHPLQSIDFKTGIPAESHTTLDRRGVLSCHTACEIVLMLPNAAINDSVENRPHAPAQ